MDKGVESYDQERARTRVPYQIIYNTDSDMNKPVKLIKTPGKNSLHQYHQTIKDLLSHPSNVRVE